MEATSSSIHSYTYATHRMPEDPSEIVYEWQLNENSTRLEHAEAWSDDQTRRIRFSITTAVNLLVALSSLVLIAAILSSKKIRSNSFNLYVLYTALPDCFSAFSCFLTCAMAVSNDAMYYSNAMCGFQAFYLSFAITCNGWMNGLIVYEVHKLLRYSQIRKRYFPPTRKQVSCQAAVVYMYAFAIGMFSTFNIQGSPIKTINWNGYVCFPIETEYRWGWFYFLVYLPLMVIIPCSFSFGAMAHIYWCNLLPKQGPTLTIALFLLRIICLYFFVWTPFLIQAIVLYFYPASPWVSFWASVVAHTQAFFTTVMVYYTNNELKYQMNKIMTFKTCLCSCTMDDDDDDVDRPKSFFFKSVDGNIIHCESRTSHISRLDSQNDIPVFTAVGAGAGAEAKVNKNEVEDDESTNLQEDEAII